MVPAPRHCQKHRPIGVIDAADLQKGSARIGDDLVTGGQHTQAQGTENRDPCCPNSRQQRQIWRAQAMPGRQCDITGDHVLAGLTGIRSHLDRTVEGYAVAIAGGILLQHHCVDSCGQNRPGQDADRHSLRHAS